MRLEHVLHLYPLFVPEQLPERYLSVEHVLLEHVRHDPFLVPDEPKRYCVDEHLGCALHLNPSVVPLQLPVRYSDAAHLLLLHAVHAPFFSVLEPLRNSLAPHFGLKG